MSVRKAILSVRDTFKFPFYQCLWLLNKIQGTPYMWYIFGKPWVREYIKIMILGVKYKNVQNLINVSTLKVYFFKMYLTCVSSKLCEFIIS